MPTERARGPWPEEDDDRLLATAALAATGPLAGLAGSEAVSTHDAQSFFIRAFGSIVCRLQDAGNDRFRNRDTLPKRTPKPGDILFVPEEMSKTAIVHNASDRKPILHPFALGIAAFEPIGN